MTSPIPDWCQDSPASPVTQMRIVKRRGRYCCIYYNRTAPCAKTVWIVYELPTLVITVWLVFVDGRTFNTILLICPASGFTQHALPVTTCTCTCPHHVILITVIAKTTAHNDAIWFWLTLLLRIWCLIHQHLSLYGGQLLFCVHVRDNCVLLCSFVYSPCNDYIKWCVCIVLELRILPVEFPQAVFQYSSQSQRTCPHHRYSSPPHAHSHFHAMHTRHALTTCHAPATWHIRSTTLLRLVVFAIGSPCLVISY